MYAHPLHMLYLRIFFVLLYTMERWNGKTLIKSSFLIFMFNKLKEGENKWKRKYTKSFVICLFVAARWKVTGDEALDSTAASNEQP